MARDAPQPERLPELTAALLDATLSKAPVGLGFWDRELRYLRINQRLAEMNGLTPEEHLGRTVPEVLPELAPTLVPLFERVLHSGQTLSDLEISGETPAAPGTTRHWLASYFPVHGPDGALLGMGCAVTDITERKHAEEEARQAADLEKRLVGIVSHDVRSPLAAIMASVGYLLRSEQLAPAHVSTVERIHRSSERIKRLVNLLLDFTLSRHGPGLLISPEPGELGALCRAVVDAMSPRAPDQPLRLHLRGDLHGHWDMERLHQVLSQLLDNALKYGTPGAPVTLRAQGAPDTVTLEVHNSGEPIPRELLPRLFSPFTRGPRPHHHTVRLSSGLGLYIACEVVKAHGGTLHATSSAPEGTCFRVCLPRHAPAPPAEAPTAS